MELEYPHCTRCCAASGRDLQPGEDFFSVLLREGHEVRRLDYAADAWPGPPEEAIGWWKSRMPVKLPKRKVHLAPNDVLLQLFEELEGQEEQQPLRYVLALLLVRRRVARWEDAWDDEDVAGGLTIYCPRVSKQYTVAIVPLSEDEQQVLQQRLEVLLFSEAA